MKTVINARFLTRRVSGVERYAREIMRCLGDDLRAAAPARPLPGAAGHGWEQFVLPAQIRPGEILWSPANSGPLRVSNQVLTLHDLSPLEHPEWFSPAYSSWYRLFLPQLARRVKKILTPSETVRRKVIARFSLEASRVICTSAGVDQDVFHPARTVSQDPYLLFVGTHEPRKNLAVLLQAWEMIRPRHPELTLVLAGGSGNVFRKATLPGKMEGVKFPGYIPEEELPGLYAGATLFILPSLDEGFGLPVLEAMACGVPVIAAQAGALPEVVGRAGLMFDPLRATSLAAAIESCLDDAGLRRTLRARGLERCAKFTWPAAAQKVREALQTCQ